ncbi:hypothetical protein J568_4579, partial [Acinetobacter baumannii 6112]
MHSSKIRCFSCCTPFPFLVTADIAYFFTIKKNTVKTRRKTHNLIIKSV